MVGLVPTMGALHAGHESLFRAARAECATVVASVFVNPAQFGDPADLERYPRDEAHDVATAERAGVDLLFAPAVEEMYPPGFDTWVDVERLGSILEGAFRPGHFRGVATICLKLFNIVRPDARLLRPEGRAAGAGDPSDDPGSAPRRWSFASVRPCATRMASPCRPAMCGSALPSGFAPSPCRVRWRVAIPRRLARCSRGSRRGVSSRSLRSIRPCSRRPFAWAGCA